MNYYYPYPPMYQYPTGGYSPFQPQNVADTDESSYIENILRLNLGKIISVYKWQYFSSIIFLY